MNILPNPTTYPSRELNDTNNPIIFLLVDDSDHFTPVTGVTPSVTLIKTNGDLSVPAGQVTEIGAGGYKITLLDGNLDAPGDLLVHVTATGADPVLDRYTILANAGLATTDWDFDNDQGFANSRVGYVFGQQYDTHGGAANR